MAVLVAYDGSEPAKQALERAVNEFSDVEIILLRVVEAADSSTGAGVNLARERLRKLRESTDKELTDDVTERIAAADVDYRTEIVVGEPAREIVAFAEENDVDHILVGNHGRSGVSRVLLGSVAESVVRRASVPVTVVR